MQKNILLSKAHARFRQLRNGEVVDNLAAQGITYRIAWGLESYRLKEIAEEVKSHLFPLVTFEQSPSPFSPLPSRLSLLSDALWAEDVRESKMLATRLYPAEEFPKEKAQAWIKEAKYTEIIDQLTMNLLAKVPYAEDLLEELGNNDDIELYCALKLATRIEKQSEKLLEKANNILTTDVPVYLKTAALWYKQLFEQE